MSFPPATEMFQFAGFASQTYGFSLGYPLLGGLPHSEIPGSTIARISPGLFAACHVLHRLSVPRHPPDALTLRLSATPNGKDHCSIKPTPQAEPTGATDSPSPGKTKGNASVPPLRRHFVAGSRHAAPRTSRGTGRSSRYGHTTRFFTIVNQQHAPQPTGPEGNS